MANPVKKADGGEHGGSSSESDAVGTEPLPQGLAFFAILATLMLCCFIAALDMTIVATAVPSMTETFQSLSDIGWYGSAFLLTEATFQATWGKAYGIFDLRTVFAISIAVFEIGCLTSAVAPNSSAVIVGRAISGVGASGITVGVFTIIAFITSEEARTAFIGIIGATFGSASVVGPFVGGVLTSHVSWRWTFWINLPVGGVALLALFLFFKKPESARNARKPLTRTAILVDLDLVGSALTTASMVCFMFAMQWGGTARPWSSGPVVATLALFGILTVAFCFNERLAGDRALMPLRLLARWPTWPNCVYTFLISGVYFPLVYLLPVYFQAIQGVGAEQSGIRNIPLILGVALFTIASTWFMGRTRLWTLPLVAGAVIAVAGSALIYTLDVDSTSGQWIGYQVLVGAGVGIAMEVPLVANQQNLPLEDISAMVGLTMFFENAGGAIFVSAGQAIFTNGLLQSLGRTAPNLDARDVLNHGALNIEGAFGDDAPAVLESYMAGLREAFIMVLVCAAAASVVSLVVSLSFVFSKRKPARDTERARD